MSEPVLCECGAVLVKDVDAHGVTTVQGEYIRFMRKTDFVLCPSCHRSHAVRDLLPKGSEPEEQ